MSAKGDVVGEWSFFGETRRLEIRSTRPFEDLSGTWSVRAFGVLLEGLSLARLERALATQDEQVDCDVVFSNGRRLLFDGAFDGAGEANGVLRQVAEFGEVARNEVGKLTPAFQPIFTLDTQKVAGFEALARWDGEEELGAGARFDDPGLARNMILQSAEILVDWHRVTGNQDLFVHVNLTGRDLAVESLPGLINAVVRYYNLPKGGLKVELTEQAALRDVEKMQKVAQRISDIGSGLVLDDFGSGHSSFAWLADLPATSLKIDESLTRRANEPRIQSILKAVTQLARELHLDVTAEGIEKEQDIPLLRALGFTYGQGFAFARPMFAKDSLEFLKGLT